MAFDFFTQIQSPPVPISLYGDAATQGIEAGIKLPTDTTATMQGIMAGISTGQKYLETAADIEAKQQQNVIRENQIEQLPVANAQQAATLEQTRQENAIRQNQIEQLPVANQMQQIELENAQKINEINRLRLDLDQKTHSQKIENELNKIQSENAKFDEQKASIEIKKKIAQKLSNPDPNVQKEILNDPDMVRIITNEPDYGRGVIDAIASNNAISESEKNKYLERIDFVKARELAAQEERARIKAREEEFKKLDKLEEDINATEGVVNSLSSGGYKNARELLREDVKVVPSGQTVYLKDKDGKTTDVVDPNATPDYAGAASSGKPTSYDVIVNGRRLPTPLFKDTEAAQLNKYLNLNRERYGIKTTAELKSAEKAKEDLQAPATPSAAPARNVQELSKSLEAQGMPSKTTTPLLEKGRELGFSRNLIERTIDKIVPDAPAATHLTIKESNSLGEIITDTASQLAEKTMNSLKTADSETKQTIRDWAKLQGVELNRKSLDFYYRNKLAEEFDKAFREAEDFGIEQKTKAVKQSNAENAAARLLSEKTPLEIMSTKKAATPPARAAISSSSKAPAVAPKEEGVTLDFYNTSIPDREVMDNLDTKVDDLRTRYGLSKAKADELKTVTARVETNEYLKDQPAYVKAIAAVEAGGRNKAVSSTNVVGPMQVTKGVAESYGKNRQDPQQNVEAGAKYIDYLINKFDGARSLAYAAYNTGPAVIKHAQKLAGGSTDWNDLKPHLLDALIKYQNEGKWNPAVKLRELYSYPEKVALYEEIFEGSIPSGGMVA